MPQECHHKIALFDFAQADIQWRFSIRTTLEIHGDQAHTQSGERRVQIRERITDSFSLSR